MFRRIIGVFGVSAMGQVINLLIRIISLPVFLNYWGKDIYGEWLVLLAIPTYFTMSGSGFSVVAANEMSMKASKGLFEDASGVFQSVWLFMSGMAVLFFLLCTACVALLPVEKWFGIHFISPHHTRLILLFMVVYAAFFLQGELLLGVYRAGEIFAKGLFINNLILLVENIGLLLVVAFSFNVLVAAAVFAALRILGTLITAFVIKRNVIWLRFGYQNASVRVVRTNLLPTLSFVGSNMSNALTSQGIVAVIGIRLGAAAVVSFTVVRTLVNLIKQVNTLIYYSAWPEFSTALATGNRELAGRLHRYTCQFTFLFTLFSVIGLMVFGMPVMKLWTSGKVELSYPFLVMMLAAAIPNTFYVTSSYVQVSINKIGKIAVLSLLASLISLGFIYLTVPLFNILAVPFILLVIDSVLLLIVVKDSLHIVQDKLPDFIRSMFDFSYLRKIAIRGNI